jgi:hypothetical protein
MKRAKPKKKKKKTMAHNPRHASIRNVIKEDTWSSLGGVSSIITSKELSKTMIS